MSVHSRQIVIPCKAYITRCCSWTWGCCLMCTHMLVSRTRVTWLHSSIKQLTNECGFAAMRLHRQSVVWTASDSGTSRHLHLPITTAASAASTRSMRTTWIMTQRTSSPSSQLKAASQTRRRWRGEQHGMHCRALRGAR